jgi:hypothetical protein
MSNIRKEITLTVESKRALGSMALDADTNLKQFIEAQLIAMGAKGIPYTDLWQQCEAMAAQLKQLANQ